MANLLNYKYEIFPTQPQRKQLNKILKQAKIQWNKAVTIRKKLKSALIAGQVEYVLKTLLSVSAEKKNWQANRKKAIQKSEEQGDWHSSNFEESARLYNIKTLVGKIMEVDQRHLDLAVLAQELKEKYDSELAEYKQWKKARGQGDKKQKSPKRPVYWQLIKGINNCAGFSAKEFMDKSYDGPPKGTSLSKIRFNVSGSANAERWNSAVNPSKSQRAYGAPGEPNYKGRMEGFAYQIPQKDNTKIDKLIRARSRQKGHLIEITALPKGMRWVPLAYHRPIPKGSKIKQLTINQKAGRYFVVLSLEAPDEVWQIIPNKLGWQAGIDPGASVALTIAFKNSNNGELRHLAVHYEILEKGLEKLEKMQQELAQKKGNWRKRTEQEIEEELNKLKNKSSFKKLSPEEQEKQITSKRKKLEQTTIKQEPSKRWIRWKKRVSALQMRFANQRADILHKISRALAEGCELIAIGDWEPEKQVAYRKKIRAVKKKIKAGVQSAKQELSALENEKSKQGPKGARKKRRSARDRSIATLRRLVQEKAQRANIKAEIKVKEAGSTYTCWLCGSETGPKGDLSIREWRCEQCGAFHNRDLNSAFNILKKVENKKEFAPAQGAIPGEAPESMATRTMKQGAMEQPGEQSSDSHATASSGKGGAFLDKHASGSLVKFWDEESTPKALKSLKEMGVARALDSQTAQKNRLNNLSKL